MILALWILLFGSIIYGLVKLCQPGISREVRNMIMTRHVVTILFFTISNLYLQVSTFYWVINSAKTSYTDRGGNVDNSWTRALKIIFVIQGLVLPLSRLSEPFFFRVVYRRTKNISCCCCSRSKDDRKIELANDLTFLKRGIKASDLDRRASQLSTGTETSDQSSTIT